MEIAEVSRVHVLVVYIINSITFHCGEKTCKSVASGAYFGANPLYWTGKYNACVNKQNKIVNAMSYTV